MENKTKEQLAEEYANECEDCYSNDYWGFIKGYDSRQPEIDRLKEQIPKWIKTSEQLPERELNVRYSQVPCLVIHSNQICILQFNHEHECWDDEDGDDYCCDIESIEYWMPLPNPPKQTKP